MNVLGAMQSAWALSFATKGGTGKSHDTADGAPLTYHSRVFGTHAALGASS